VVFIQDVEDKHKEKDTDTDTDTDADRMVANAGTCLHTPAQHKFSTCKGACENETCRFNDTRKNEKCRRRDVSVQNARYDTRLELTLGKRQEPAPLSHTQPLGTCFQIRVRVRVRAKLRVRARGNVNVRVRV
jgi:hypothetical protein